MSRRCTECYLLDPQAHSLRVQISPGHSLLLPYEQLAFAEFAAEESEDAFTMHFDTHEVTLRGTSLRRLEAALQRRELANVVPTTLEFRGGVKDGQPLITAIEVVAAPATDSERDHQMAHSDREARNGSSH